MYKILFIALLVAFVAGHLEFDYSRVYDMFDFKGTPNYPINGCNVTGCRVYLTYLDEPLDDQYLGQFTVALDDVNNITFHDLRMLQRENGEKGYFDIPVGTDEFSIHNPNGNLATRALALWVVRNDAPFIDSLEVYEATDGANIETNATRIMMMRVDAFTASVAIEGNYSATVKTSPFDMLDSGECEHVLRIDNSISQSFSQAFNSPIISLGFKETSEFSVKINTNFDFPVERSIDVSGYLASPGYIGCANKTFVFRSDNYNIDISGLNETFLVDGEKKRHVSFYGDINTDDDAPVLFYDMETDAEPLIIVGTQIDNTSTWEYELDTSSFSIHWDAWAKRWGNESFMIRYEVDGSTGPPPDTPKTTLSTKPTVPTSSSSTTTTLPPKASTSKVDPVPTTEAPEETTEKVDSSTTVVPTSSTTVYVTTSSCSMISTVFALLSVVVSFMV